MQGKSILDALIDHLEELDDQLECTCSEHQEGRERARITVSLHDQKDGNTRLEMEVDGGFALAELIEIKDDFCEMIDEMIVDSFTRRYKERVNSSA